MYVKMFVTEIYKNMSIIVITWQSFLVVSIIHEKFRYFIIFQWHGALCLKERYPRGQMKLTSSP